MFNQALKSELAACQTTRQALQAEHDAIRREVALIEFAPDGTVLHANDRFLQVVGYPASAVVGRHHRLFCDADYAAGQEYRAFWDSLRRGERRVGTFARRDHAGRRLFLEATYLPVVEQGRVSRILKIASDVTEQTRSAQGQTAVVDALNRSLAVITFTADGEVLAANDNFLRCMGYRLDEIRGQHHRLFCLPGFYQQQPRFWAELKQGQFKSGRFERVTKHGESIWLEATYNPIADETGAIVKVIKFASDITERARQGAAVRQAAQLAHEISDQSAALANEGAELLQQTVDNAEKVAGDVGAASAMLQQLAQQSREISAIVTTIRSIAEQTNLLALNAAIEAARAGDFGRGFAVVADEVRNLAARTASSTVEIENVVKRNAELTNKVVDSMAEAMTQADRSTVLVNETYQKIGEIRAGAENVSATVAQLSLSQKA